MKALRLALLSLFVFTLLSPSPAYLQGERVVLLPFEAQGISGELQEALWDMFSSRLMEKGQDVLERAALKRVAPELTGPFEEPTARAIGRRLGTRWVIWGKVRRIGNTIAVDLKVLDSLGVLPTRAVYGQYPSEEALLAGLEALAQGVREKVTGRAEATFRQKGELRAQLLYQALGYSRLLRLGERLVKGVALADLDGDNRKELILMGQSEIWAYKVSQEGLKALGELKLPSTYNLLAVGALDLDGQRGEEVAVTAVLEDNLKSFVLRWEGNGFGYLLKDVNRYLRVVDLGGRKALLAQAMGSDLDFVGPIEELRLKDGKAIYEALKGIPRDTWVFGFAQGRFTGGGIEVVRLTGLGELELLGQKGERIWKGGKGYCLSDNYFDRPKVMADEKGMPSGVPRRVYLPVKMAAVDLDGDGVDELVVVENRFTLGQTLQRVRLYGSGRVLGLLWDGMSMAQAWQTQEMPGCLFDFDLEDIDGDGLRELVAVVVSGSALKKPSSSLVVFELYD